MAASTENVQSKQFGEEPAWVSSTGASKNLGTKRLFEGPFKLTDRLCREGRDLGYPHLRDGQTEKKLARPAIYLLQISGSRAGNRRHTDGVFASLFISSALGFSSKTTGSSERRGSTPGARLG